MSARSEGFAKGSLGKVMLLIRNGCVARGEPKPGSRGCDNPHAENTAHRLNQSKRAPGQDRRCEATDRPVRSSTLSITPSQQFTAQGWMIVKYRDPYDPGFSWPPRNRSGFVKVLVPPFKVAPALYYSGTVNYCVSMFACSSCLLAMQPSYTV